MSDPLRAPRGGGEFGVEIEAGEVDPWFLTQLHAALKSPLFSVPKPFETWMIDKVVSSGFDLPISQIIGFAGFLAQEGNTIVTPTETTTSTTYTDLATVGPSISGLTPGRYLIFFGNTSSTTSSSAQATTSVQVNATAASDADMLLNGSTTTVPVSRAILKDLALESNTLTMKYKAFTAGTASFRDRWMIALKIANL